MKTISKLPYVLCLCLFSIVLVSTLVIRHFGNYTIQLHTGNAYPIVTENEKTIISGKVNINSASCQELDMLPGIGEVLAQRIIDYRQRHGPFRSTEDLLNVKGIGNAKLKAISDYIIVGGTS